MLRMSTQTCKSCQPLKQHKMRPTKRTIPVILIFGGPVHVHVFDSAFESNVPSANEIDNIAVKQFKEGGEQKKQIKTISFAL